MNSDDVKHVKSQLQVLRESDNLDYSKGLIDGLLAYLESACPEIITIRIIGPKTNSIIEGIKAIRVTLNLGLVESKALFEARGLVYTGQDLGLALKVLKGLQDVLELDVTGLPKSVNLFYKKD